MLARAEELAAAAQTGVLLRQLKTIGRPHQDLDALLGLVACWFGEKKALTRYRSSANPPAYLMELRQAKAFRMFHDQQRGIGHVHANLDHGSADQEIELSISK